MSILSYAHGNPSRQRKAHVVGRRQLNNIGNAAAAAINSALGPSKVHPNQQDSVIQKVLVKGTLASYLDTHGVHSGSISKELLVYDGLTLFTEEAALHEVNQTLKGRAAKRAAESILTGGFVKYAPEEHGLAAGLAAVG